MSPLKSSVSWLLVSACALVSGCAPSLESVQAITQTAAPTTAATETPDTPTPQPTPTITPVGPSTLVIWIPEALLPDNDESLTALLDAEVNEFITVEENVQVDIRRKTTNTVGGIMSTLRTASAVAPGALPDITLLRREDLLTAVESGLIQPLEGRIASAVIADLYPSALRLGRADNQLFGLPYLLDVYLYAYRETDAPAPDAWTFDSVIDRGQTFALPAETASGMSDVLWLQYAATSGTQPDDETFELVPSAVIDVFEFYQRLSDSQRLVPGVLDYSSPADYVDALADGRIETGIVTSSDLRSLANANPPLHYAPVPTKNGDPVTLVDGWMWVIVAPDTAQQALAGRFLNWMMEAGRHSNYAQAISMPPAQRGSLRRWSFAGLENSLLVSMLAGSLPAHPDADSGGAARAFQAAWQDVLAGRRTASDAATSALER